jgi:hypothetical protein
VQDIIFERKCGIYGTTGQGWSESLPCRFRLRNHVAVDEQSLILDSVCGGVGAALNCDTIYCEIDTIVHLTTDSSSDTDGFWLDGE